MKCLPLLLQFLLCFASRTGAKVFERCELAKMLKNYGLDGYRGYSLANWVCMAFYESGFDTKMVRPQDNGSTSNGIFQINSYLWCEDYKHYTPNICQMHCSDLLTSYIRDDVACAMRIVQGPKGLGAWKMWKKNCEGEDVDIWLKGCEL
ncbi:sperm acrosome membrane-associated protein 3 [Anolis carolinensis]|nr:PREDICTED: sperm acrosome membrane-associated protein 3 [Anolis carolinensis]|eukprot:XP_016851264.1 PREDICTED: sperm acrosome membrane-associated protein 3 [Anolis carolinensis]